ncbi:ribbon-helix-helix domain-containing protein (plasmid) [Cereibacter azotoformans]|uniref:ribbon-helix-helix domain-containing protein n=1 Tax=Cereibacter azotoformans TaxID=43057 RepID=UPI001F2208B6|nr:ribbon-helix-helix domain-containing protein [Cereibacter azotoformans]UIJ33249.1 ribbon-helix-helix domain-containing protein [Cereibacter azotoformans]
MTSKHRVSVNLSPDEHRELDALAKGARISKAWLGRQAITEFLDRHRGRKMQHPLDLSSTRTTRRPE